LTGRGWRRGAAGTAGFTLLETLVALALLGIVLTTVFGLIGSGLRAAHRDEDRLLLALVAQNLLARSRLDLTPTGDGALSGDIGGGLRWQIESRPYQLPERILPEPPPPQPGLSRLDEGRQDEEIGSPSMAERGDSGFSRDGGTEADATGGERAGPGEREGEQERERVRLRLVRVTVEKGEEHFELTSLAAEPGRDDRLLGRDERSLDRDDRPLGSR
jgi:type II secretion system protein I